MGKSNSGQAAQYGLEVTYSYNSNEKPIREVTWNNKVQAKRPPLRINLTA